MKKKNLYQIHWWLPMKRNLKEDKIPVTSDELNDAEKYYLEDTQTVEPQQQENNLAKQNGPVKEIKQEYKNQNDAKSSPGYTEEYTIKRKNEDTNTNSKNTDTKDTNTEDTNTNSKNTDTKDTNTEDTNSKNTSTKDTKKKSTDPKKKKTDSKKKSTKTKKKNKKTKKAEHDDCESCYEMRAVSGDHDADLPDL
nr:aspartate and serine-rich protein-like [Helicoverpa armigera]